jgi:hypothetical protein
VAADEINSPDANTEPKGGANTPAAARRSLRRAALAGIRGHRRIARSLALIAVAAVIGAAYAAGGPPSTQAHDTPKTATLPAERYAAGGSPVPGAVDAAGKGTDTWTETGQGGSNENPALAAADAAQIIKTGELSLEVSAIDGAVDRAKAAVAGLGGTVDSSNQYGTGDEAGASVTFRVPAAKWDEAISTLRAIGTKVLSLRTSSTDVTLQAVDLDARIANLEKTEAALQAIMARATAIADVIAVERQLSQVEGQIEELKAQRNHLQNQVAMSTLTVTFQLPAKTVTTQATQDWTLGHQIDQAGAALVRIGQGLVTLCVWLVVVVVPLALAVLVLFGIVWMISRVFGRGRRRGATAGV